MNFILVGYDPSAELFVRAALANSHRLIAFLDVPSDLVPPEFPGANRLETLEEIAGVGDIDFLVLSGGLQGRAERIQYVLRLDPVDLVVTTPLADKPDVYYELSLIRGETGIAVYPLIGELVHPALPRLKELLAQSGPVRSMEWSHPMAPGATGVHRFLGGWCWLRKLDGDITGVSAIGSTDEPTLTRNAIVSVRMENGNLVTVRWLADADSKHRLRIETETGSIECHLPEGLAGPATLRWDIIGGSQQTEEFAASALGQAWFEHRLNLDGEEEEELWVQATRQIEIAEATDRSLRQGRAVSLTYDEFSEQASFKSVMTLWGCGMIWALILVAALVAAEVPFVGRLVLPALGIFLLFQLFGFVYQKR